MIKQKVLALKEEEEKAIKLAFESTPKKYHGYLVLLEQNQKIASNVRQPLSQELLNLGCFEWKGGVFCKTKNPYITVDGRVAMATDETKETKKEYSVESPDFFQLGNQWLCSVKVHTARGVATGIAKVGLGGTGADATNPHENAQTSAVGRALGFLGYGLVGTGIASAEEVSSAMKEQGEMKKEAQKSSTPKGAKEKGPQKPETEDQGQHPVVLRGVQIKEANGKKIYAVALNRPDEPEKVFATYLDPALNDKFEKLGLGEGEIFVGHFQRAKGTLVLANVEKSEVAA